jgi:16S rRNA (cytosine1402-N4)-methyltransferase
MSEVPQHGVPDERAPDKGVPDEGAPHEPVLLTEVVDWLRASEGGLFVDCTVGLGGHAEAILDASPQSRVIGLDRDLESLQLATRRLERFGDRFIGNQANFKELKPVLDSLAIIQAAGILADLGISSFQLASEERGFSFQTDAPLDMRMDRSRGATASDLVNSLSEAELADLIFKYGEERGARRIARGIVRERGRQPVTGTIQLAQIVVRALNVPGRWRIHPATRTFQALRIAVNGELEGLAEFVTGAASYLEPSGRLAVISFHSLEDGIIKRAFRLAAGQCQCQPRRHAPRHQDYVDTLARQSEVRAVDHQIDKVVCDRCGARKLVDILTKKPIQPSQDEVRRNPRARSARLRVCSRLR